MDAMPEVIQKFVLHWGEMGTRWGVNRTVAQIHALLWVTERPLHAEEICELLGVARSNVSNSLRELQNWGIVKIVHLPRDRRDHFQCMEDVYEMFRLIVEERKRREVDPTVQVLKECSEQVATDDSKKPSDVYAQRKLREMLEFFELGVDSYERMSRMPTAQAVNVLRMGDKLLKIIGLGGDSNSKTTRPK